MKAVIEKSRSFQKFAGLRARVRVGVSVLVFKRRLPKTNRAQISQRKMGRSQKKLRFLIDR